MKKLAVLLAVVMLIAGFFLFDLHQYLDFSYVKSRQALITDYFHTYPVKTVLIFFLAYFAVAGLSLPGAGVLSVLAGAIFGLPVGAVTVLLAATAGATVAFWLSRYIFHDFVQNRFGDKLRAVNTGIERDGAFYLFTLRLIPIFPFFVINLVMGLTPMRTAVFSSVSLLGMLPGSIIFVNVGTQLADLESLGGILTLDLVVAFGLLAIFPWVARKVLVLFRARRAYAGFRRPRKYDRNLIVIGAGSGGLIAAYIAAMVKARVTLIEKGKMGGDCLNTGCVPSKALIRSAKFISQAKRAVQYGCEPVEVNFDFSKIMQRVRRVIGKIEPHDSVERYTKLGVECIQGEAELKDPWTVAVNEKNLTSRNIILATGASPFIPEIPGLSGIEYHTSDTIWSLEELPERMVVLGGGPIGCELAQCFARFGSSVTQVQRGPRILPREDPECSAMVAESFARDGVRILTGHVAKEVLQEAGSNRLVCAHNGEEVNVPFDTILVAVGRKVTSHSAWENHLQIELQKDGRPALNEFLQTNYPNIYACGDLAGPYQFTHTASHQAWYASVNALFGRFRKFRVDYSVIPWCTFTEPEVARVGLNEQEAKNQGVEYEVTRYDLSDLDRAIADEQAHGMVKVLTVPGKDRILGATIVGEHAGDLITEYISAMKHKLGLGKILGTIHIYPTLAEANKAAAGEWKRAHAPQRMLNWVKRYHAFERR
ncbi:MAG: FAD-dependent oxidoreductase [Gammaproteobacteria bacterium]|nr:FAD-dependent oxidoreductase [Gammaproteobacteria bacterium]